MQDNVLQLVIDVYIQIINMYKREYSEDYLMDVFRKKQ